MTEQKDLPNPFFYKRGIFFISRKLISEHPELVMNLLSNILIVSAVNLFITEGIEYEGYSNEFEEIKDFGEVSPYYDTIIYQENNEIVDIHLEKKK